MNTDLVDALDESICKRILDRLACKMLGNGSYVSISSKYCYPMMIEGGSQLPYFFILFNNVKGLITPIFNGSCRKDFTYKTVLKTLVSSLTCTGDYIAHISSIPNHFMDYGTSIEQIVIYDDLASAIE